MPMSTHVILANVRANRQLDYAQRYIERERAILARWNVQARLGDLTASKAGRRKFAEVFYSVRVQFVRHNFMIGARCPYNETYWRGIVGNLREELGGSRGLSHNELYRRFLYSVGGAPESALNEPEFAKAFNESWQAYIQEHDVESSIYAIAIYEILDNPDYEMLVSALTMNEALEVDLEFFIVHAKATHTRLFGDFLNHMESNARRHKWETDAAEFVFGAQEKMWRGLIMELEGSGA